MHVNGTSILREATKLKSNMNCSMSIGNYQECEVNFGPENARNFGGFRPIHKNK